MTDTPRLTTPWLPVAWLLILLPLLLLPDWPSDAMGWEIVRDIRLPRFLLAALAGGALALAGLWLQTLFRHALVEPGLLGVSSGAALSAVLCLVLLPGLVWLMPLAAWVGAALALFAVLGIARRYQVEGESLLLAGVAFNALLAGATQLLLTLAPDQALRAGTFWLMGSFAQAELSALPLPALLLALLFAWGWRRTAAFDLWQLGDREAGQLGLPVQRFRLQVIWASAALVALAVAQAGAVAFIGLMAPHLAARRVGCHQRALMPATVVIGAGLAILADTFARVLLYPLELPVGIMTALLGAPFFLLLLHGRWQR